MAYKIKNVWTGDEYKDAYLSEKEVRELASQLPQETLEKLVDCKKETEQQRVSDCWCGGEVSRLNPNKCVAGKENCDAVEPDDKIEKIDIKDKPAVVGDIINTMLDWWGSDKVHSYRETEKVAEEIVETVRTHHPYLEHKINEIIEKINND